MNSASDHLEAGVALTFDDVIYLDQWLVALDTLTRAYNFRATFFIDHFDRLNQRQIDKLHLIQNLGSEIGYHGLRHRDAVSYCKDNSVSSYLADEILPGLQIMQEKGFFPVCFAYPLGSRQNNIDKALLNHFKILRGTYAYGITKPPASYYGNYHSSSVLSAVKIDSDSPCAVPDIFEGLHYAYQYNCAIILYGHGVSEARMPLYVPLARLYAICSFVDKNSMKFYTLSELVKL